MDWLNGVAWGIGEVLAEMARNVFPSVYEIDSCSKLSIPDNSAPLLV
jgi:hypothetical protein